MSMQESTRSIQSKMIRIIKIEKIILPQKMKKEIYTNGKKDFTRYK